MLLHTPMSEAFAGIDRKGSSGVRSSCVLHSPDGVLMRRKCHKQDVVCRDLGASVTVTESVHGGNLSLAHDIFDGYTLEAL